MKRTLFVLLGLCSVLMLWAHDFKPSEVPNPKTRSQNCWVSDVDALLSTAAVDNLNGIISKLNGETGVEIAVVALPSIEGDDEYDFAYQLFNLWKIGEAGKDNGLLLLYVEDIRAVKFETGLGLEGLLPDAFLDKVLNSVMFPLMKQGEIDDGLVAGVNAVVDHLSTDEAREELLLFRNQAQLNWVTVVTWYLAVGLMLMLLFFIDLYLSARNIKGENNIKYAKFQSAYTLAIVFSCIFPLPMIFFFFYLRRFRKKIRRQPLVCDHCGGSMRLLSEDEEDAFLNLRQQAEESVKSIDYDVWKCNVCDNFKILPYENSGSKYTECPVCHAKTYSLVENRILMPPTHISAGKGMKEYRCRNCSHHDSIAYIIPIIIAASSGSSKGGGFSGGSFGGGMSGGGGAGGRF